MKYLCVHYKRYKSDNCFTEEKKVELPSWANIDKSECKSDVDGELGFVGYLLGERGNCPFFGAVFSKNFLKRGV
jgi:hypothetical protein